MAANQSSPGVVIQERDLTTITTQSTANIGVIAAPFEQGPVEEIVDISSERELADVFGKPNDFNYEYWYTAAQFLSYGGVLKTVRVANTALKNAVNTGTAPLIKNFQDYETNFEEANNTWKWAAKTPGTKGNSIGIFMTDAGADQIAVMTAPGSGNEHEFVADEAVSAASGAAGKVFKYSILLTVDTIVGDFTPGASTTINIGGSEEAVTVLAWDPSNKKLEIGLPSGGVTGILADGQAITQGNNTAAIDTTIERRLYVALNKDSIALKATDAVADTNSTSVTVSAVRNEYDEREYLPGVKWVNVAVRPNTSKWATEAGGYRDEMHIVVVDIDGKITGTTGALLERFVGVSKASDAKTSVGETNYYVNVVKARSEYIYWGEHETGVFNATGTPADGNWGLSANRQFNLLRSAAGSTDYPAGRTTLGSKNNATFYYRLASGTDYAASGGVYTVSNTDVATAYELLEDPESQTIDFILTGPSGVSDTDAIAKVNALVNIAEERREAAMHERQLSKESFGNVALIYLGGFAYNAYRSGKELVLWLKEVSDLVNPVVRMEHRFKAAQAAWLQDNLADAANVYAQTYVEGEKRELVEALGFDPTTITLEQLDEAMAMAISLFFSCNRLYLSRWPCRRTASGDVVTFCKFTHLSLSSLILLSVIEIKSDAECASLINLHDGYSLPQGTCLRSVFFFSYVLHNSFCF